MHCCNLEAKLEDVVGINAIILRRHLSFLDCGQPFRNFGTDVCSSFIVSIAFMLTISFAPFCRLIQL